MAVCSLNAAAQRIVAELDAVAAALLGLVHREVGVAEHLVGGEVGIVPDRHADGDVHTQGHLTDPDGLAHGLAEALGEVERGIHVGDRFGDDEELVAAEAADVVSAAHDRLETLRHRSQHGVAGWMPVLIVDVLEPVEIDEQHGDPLSGPPGSERGSCPAPPARRCGSRAG